MILFSTIWGIGGTLDSEDRERLNRYLLKLIYYEDVRKSFDIDIEYNGW